MKIRLMGLALTGVIASSVALVANAKPTVYIPLGNANKILVVDAKSDKIRGTIGDVQNIHGLAVTPDGRFLIAGSNVEVQPRKKAIPPKPTGMSEEEHRRHHSAPPASKAHTVGKSYVSIICTNDYRVIRRIEVRGAVHHNTVTPDGRYAISTHTSAGGISLIDLKTYKVFKTIATGLAPNYAIVTRDGSRIYVSNTGNKTVSEIDTKNWIVTRNMIVGLAPEHMVISPDEVTLYVNNVSDGTVSVLALATGKVVKTYRVGKQPHGIALADNGKSLFVTSKKDNRLIMINLTNNRKRSVGLSPAPYHLTAITGTGKLYASSRKEPKIWVINQATLKTSGVIKLPKGASGHQMTVVK